MKGVGLNHDPIKASNNALFMLFLLFSSTLVGMQSVKDHSHCSVMYFTSPVYSFCCYCFFKHTQVHRSRGCPAGLVNLRGIQPHATHQHVIGDLVRFAAPL